MTEASFRLAAAIVVAEDEQAAALPDLGDGRRSLAIPEHLLAAPLRSRLPEQAGRVHDLVYLLEQAELPLVAEALISVMAQELPEDFTWHFKLGRLLADQQRWAEATESLRRAHLYSYGDNRLRAAERLAAALAETGALEEARGIVDTALAPPAPEEEGVRTHRYRERLEELRTRLEEDIRD